MNFHLRAYSRDLLHQMHRVRGTGGHATEGVQGPAVSHAVEAEGGRAEAQAAEIWGCETF